MKEKSKETLVAKRRDVNVEIHYSDKAKREKTVRFTALRKNKQFELSVDELIAIVTNLRKEVLSILTMDNSELLFVDTARTITGTCDRDFKKGEQISFNYVVKTPLEIAIAEEMYNLAKADGEVERIGVEKLKEARANITEAAKEYVQRMYADFLLKQNTASEQEVTETIGEESPYSNLQEPLN